MTEQANIPANEISFKDFLLKNKRNRTILILAAVAIVIQFSVFKYFYPFASFIHGDSFSYIKSAYHNNSLNTYLIGYSKFLRLFSVFSASDDTLVAFQYLFTQSSVLFLLFTVFYFYKPSQKAQIILICFMTINPLSLQLANLISSDSLFLSLSLGWFALLIWIIHRPSTYFIVTHAIVLVLLFTVRYNAMIYPFISAIAFLLSNLSVRRKMFGISIAILLCAVFIFHTSYQYRKLTGYWQYSPFSGWQLANNAMYAYRYVNISDRKPVPQNFKVLDQMIRTFFDTTGNVKKFPSEAEMASTYYMWSPGMPLIKYRNELFKNDTAATELKKWASMGRFYKAYGLHIIKLYPMHFIRYFIWPNANKYYAPPIEFLEHYNSGRDNVAQIAQIWFEYKSQTVESRINNQIPSILSFYPILSGIINGVMLCSLLCYISLNGWRYNIPFSKGLSLASVLWLTNALFTIVASSAALRFQAFPIILTTTFAILLVDWMMLLIGSSKKQLITPLTEQVEFGDILKQTTL